MRLREHVEQPKCQTATKCIALDSDERGCRHIRCGRQRKIVWSAEEIIAANGRACFQTRERDLHMILFLAEAFETHDFGAIDAYDRFGITHTERCELPEIAKQSP